MTLKAISLIGLVSASAATVGYATRVAMNPEEEHLSQTSLRSGPSEELLFVVVASSFCVGARDPHFPDVIGSARKLVESEARRRGFGFGAIAVDVDWSVTDGLAFVNKLGAFDEVVVGRNWLNSGIEHFINPALAPLSVPQILVIKRHIDVAASAVAISDAVLIARAAGSDGIATWVASTTPFSETPRRMVNQR